MPTHAELLQQMQALKEQLDDAREQETEDAIDQIRGVMRSVGMTDKELVHLFTKRRYPKVAPKYQNAETGETWTGRGRRPLWVEAAIGQGKTLDDLAINQPAPQGQQPADLQHRAVAQAA
jgi:DNA-binding protein H-NS